MHISSFLSLIFQKFLHAWSSSLIFLKVHHNSTLTASYIHILKEKVGSSTCIAKLWSYGFSFWKLKEILDLWFENDHVFKSYKVFVHVSTNHASFELRNPCFETWILSWKFHNPTALLKQWSRRSSALCMQPIFLQTDCP